MLEESPFSLIKKVERVCDLWFVRHSLRDRRNTTHLWEIEKTKRLVEEIINRNFIMLQVKTPILIMLGEDDLRVPPSQGRKYYKVLKAQGTKTR